MTISLIVGFFLLLAAFNFFQIVKEGLHPAVVFPAIWGGTIIAIGLAEPFGYLQISADVSLLFIIGIFSFVAGSLFWQKLPKKTGFITPFDLNFTKIVWFCVAFHAVMLPTSWAEIRQITSGTGDIFESAYRMRVTSISGEEGVSAFVGNYLASGLFFVPVLLIGWIQKSVKLWVFVLLSVPWILLNIFVGGRSGLITLIFTLIYIYLSLGGKISVKSILSFGVMFIAVLIVGNLLVGKIDARVEDGLWMVVGQSVKGFFDYFLQGAILFSEFFQHPTQINPTWDALIFPCQMLEKAKLCVMPSQHQGFMSFTKTGEYGNVYSIFFSIYPKYGWLGIIFITGIYGFGSKYFHVRNRQSIFHILMAGFLFSATLLSVFSDSFGTNIYFFVKIFLISSLASFVFKRSKPRNNSSRH